MPWGRSIISSLGERLVEAFALASAVHAGLCFTRVSLKSKVDDYEKENRN